MLPGLPAFAVLRNQGQKGYTLIQLLISLVLTSIIALAGFQYYKGQHEAYIAQTNIADRQGSMRASLTELARQIRQAGYMVPGGGYAKLSTQFDTLTVYYGQAAGVNVDTVRFFVTGSPRALVKKTNQQAPQVFAENIDSARFVQVGSAPLREIAISLVTAPGKGFSGSALSGARKMATRVQLRNR